MSVYKSAVSTYSGYLDIFSVRRRYQGSEYGSYFNMAERSLVDSRMNIQCMYYRKHPMSVHVCVEPMCENI